MGAKGGTGEEMDFGREGRLTVKRPRDIVPMNFVSVIVVCVGDDGEAMALL